MAEAAARKRSGSIEVVAANHASEDEGTQWAACKCIWAACTVVDAWAQPHVFPGWQYRVVCVVSALGAVVFPSDALFATALSMRNWSRAAKAPFSFDSDIWSFFCDAAIAIGLVKAKGSDCVVSVVAPMVQAMLSIFYFGSGFWKINSSFLSPRTSCGSIFTASLLGRIWQEDWGVPSVKLSQLVVRVAPLMTIMGISFTPFPNGIANFSYTATAGSVCGSGHGGMRIILGGAR